jgi:hypothetical protein
VAVYRSIKNSLESDAILRSPLVKVNIPARIPARIDITLWDAAATTKEQFVCGRSGRCDR